MIIDIKTYTYLTEKVRQRITLPLCTIPEKQADKYNNMPISAMKKRKMNAIHRTTAYIYSNIIRQPPIYKTTAIKKNKNLISIPHSDLIAT